MQIGDLKSDCVGGVFKEAGFPREAAYACLPYSLDAYDFPRVVAALLGEKSLQGMGCRENIALHTRETDQRTHWHRAFYDGFANWQSLYRSFISDVIAKLFAETFYYQAIPTLRIHLPRNVAVGEFHTDRDYGHPEGEVTFWVPITPAFDTNSIWIERSQCKEDFEAVAAEPGCVVIFDAAHRKHGNLVNETGRTRVSFDFRCLLARDYHPGVMPKHSINSGLAFAPGGYYAQEALEPRK